MSREGNSAEYVLLMKDLECDLLKLYGPILTGDNLLKCLGYISEAAFRQSISRKTVAVPLFKKDSGSGYYVLSKDVARYLAKIRCSAKLDQDERKASMESEKARKKASKLKERQEFEAIVLKVYSRKLTPDS